MHLSTTLIVPRDILAKAHAQSCENCRFMHKLPPPDPDRECRKAHPQMTVLMIPAPPPRMGIMPRPFSSFPLVHPDQWCGEWEAKGSAG